MLFNSPGYIFLFLPIVILIYFVLNQRRLVKAGKAWLVLASLFFYGYWNPIYLPLLLSSIIVNYAVGNALCYTKSKFAAEQHPHFWSKIVLIGGILFNLGLLGYFKYTDFFIENLNRAIVQKIPLQEIVLPLGISFFTFQQIAYLVDSYQSATHEYDFLNYCLFVSFFPQLIAGPIVHHRDMMPQFIKVRNKLLNYRNMAMGVFTFTIGLFKKVVIADSFAVWANRGFDINKALSFFDAWGASLSYTFQLYYDFSGYSDMAIGAALLFNIQLPINFNSPYKALNIIDFWRRWHITLSNWLRIYLYIPLGGNRKGNINAFRNLFITFLLGGLWHGAAWTFVIWGAMHAVAVMIHRIWQLLGFKMNALVGWFITFMFVNVTWVFFRATTFADAIRVLKGMICLNHLAVSEEFAQAFNYISPWSFLQLNGVKFEFLMPIKALEYIIVFALVAFLSPNISQMIGLIPYNGKLLFKTNIKYSVLLAILFFVSLLTFVGNVTPSEFLYFNF